MNRRLITLLLFASLHFAVAQNTYEFTFVDQTLHRIVKELSGKYSFKFSYNPKELKKHIISKRISARTDADLISQVFEDLPFDIQLTNGIYLVIPKKIEVVPLALNGQVYDRQTGEPLAFAHVQSNQNGTISNQLGRFRLPPRDDSLSLTVSYIGYKPVEVKVGPRQEDITLELEQNPTLLQEVILNSSEMDQLSNQPSFFSLNPKQFNALPTLGETDVFKSIQLLPGIDATDETSSGLSIRGSLPSQNLILMDGFTLYNLDHFFGIFSTLNPNVINNVSVHKGGFGAEYGGRISSVIDVTGKTGASDKFGGGLGMNVLSANGYVHFPISSKTSAILGMRQSFTGIINSNLYNEFLTSNRRSFLESIDSGIAELDLSPTLRFYDINGKVQHRFSDKSHLDVNFYTSNDSYTGDFIEGDNFSSFNVIDEADWSNIGASINWKKQFNENLFSEFTFSGSEFSDKERLGINQTFFQDASFNTDSIFANSTVSLFDYEISSAISDITFKSNNEIDIDENNSIKTGVEFSSIKTDYESDQILFIDFNENAAFTDSLEVSGNILGTYVSHTFRTNDFMTNLGVRANYYSISGKWYLEPRFDMHYRISDYFGLKGAATFHHQFISQNSLAPFQNSDQFYWVLSDENVIPVQKSTHFILGANYGRGNWTVDLEYYRKNTDGIIENQFLILPPGVIQDIQFQDINLSGENIAEGVDLFIKYRSKKFSTWLSYSLGSSNNRFWYINENTDYPSRQDQRHEINFTTILKLGRWELSSLFLFGSGKPFTPPINVAGALTDTVFVDGSNIYDLSRINGSRLPAYHRFDVSAKYSFPIGKSNCEAGITLFNLFNRRNIKSRRYTIQYIFDEASAQGNASDEVRIIALDTPLLGFTPNFFLNIRF